VKFCWALHMEEKCFFLREFELKPYSKGKYMFVISSTASYCWKETFRWFRSSREDGRSAHLENFKISKGQEYSTSSRVVSVGRWSLHTHAELLSPVRVFLGDKFCCSLDQRTGEILVSFFFNQKILIWLKILDKNSKFIDIT